MRGRPEFASAVPAGGGRIARLFVALDLPPVIKSRLATLIDAVRPVVPDARWVSPANLHLTLSFLGRVEPSRIPGVAHALGTAVSGLVDFPLTLDGTGAFPSARRARVVWVGLSDPAGGLRALVALVRESLRSLGFEDDRPFQAHVTLARLRNPAPVTIPESVTPLRFMADRVTLFESQLGGGGPRYVPVAVFPFRREPSSP